MVEPQRNLSTYQHAPISSPSPYAVHSLFPSGIGGIGIERLFELNPQAPTAVRDAEKLMSSYAHMP